MTNGGNAAPNPAVVVNTICSSWLGIAGTILVILGIVAAPITTGDTAFRSARLIVADMFRFDQSKLWKRVLVALPVFVVSTVLMFVRFDVLWRYLFWFNQDLSIITFWAITVWLARNGKAYIITMVPAIWMSWACISYILVASEGFQLSATVSSIAGALFAALLTACFLRWLYIFKLQNATARMSTLQRMAFYKKLRLERLYSWI